MLSILLIYPFPCPYFYDLAFMTLGHKLVQSFDPFAYALISFVLFGPFDLN